MKRKTGIINSLESNKVQENDFNNVKLIIYK